MIRNRYFKLAKKQSLRSNHHTFNVGAVIRLKKRIVSFGYNVLKTHPKSNKLYKSTHAEFMALNNVPYGIDLKDAEIYVYRENASGPAMARPCIDCCELIKRSGIRKMYYSIDNGYAEESIC